MGYFKSGQLVGKARRGLLNQEESAFAIPSAEPTITDESTDILEDPRRSLDEILDVLKYDATYEDLLQYLSISGIFNLTQGDFPEWGDIQRLMTQFSQLNPFIVESLIPHHNPGMGRMLASLIREQQAHSAVHAVNTTVHNTTLGSI